MALPEYIAYFPDPVKLEEGEAGYPSPAIANHLRTMDVVFRQVSAHEYVVDWRTRLTNRRISVHSSRL